jgi:hypothetical protein
MQSVRRVYLYAPLPGPLDHMPYPHAAIALAEGLAPFGIEFYADRPYWRPFADRDKTLFRFDKRVSPADCDLVLVDRQIFAYRQDIALNAVRQTAPRAIRVLIDHTDFLRRAVEPLYDDFDIVLEAHCRVDGRRQSNRNPWPFALTTRQIKAGSGTGAFARRQWVMRDSFRNTAYPHSARVFAKRRLYPVLGDALPISVALHEPSPDPQDQLMWQQTGRRHAHDYFEDLKMVAACCCIGGWFVPYKDWFPSRLLFPGRRLLSLSGLSSRHIVQWDSWRLWEAMACGAAAVHVDFQAYGMEFPERPENWTHYIGVDLDRPHLARERLMDDPEILERVAAAGREWALAHYSPAAQAYRLLRLLGWNLAR